MPSSFRFTSIWSICVLPTRSPMPHAVAWTTSAPATSAAIEFATASPRSQCPCHSTRMFSPEGFTTSLMTKCIRATTPIGVACPQVSQMTMAFAPQLMAVVYSRLMVSGSQRVVSSVTYITSRPSDTAYFTAFSVVREQEVVGPVFGVAADGTGADEGCRLNGHAGALDDLGNRANVVLMGAGGAVGLDFQVGAADLARQRLAMRQLHADRRRAGRCRAC